MKQIIGITILVALLFGCSSKTRTLQKSPCASNTVELYYG